MNCVCACPGCDLPIADWQLACREHWYDLPIGLRDAISTAYRSDDGPTHTQAVREAITIWEGPPQPAELALELRCQHCRTPTEFTDPDSGRGVCLVCARASMNAKTVLQSCARCGSDVEVLVSLTRKNPDHCLDCITDVLELVEALS